MNLRRLTLWPLALCLLIAPLAAAASNPGAPPPANFDGVKADPPIIYFSATPAVLVNVDADRT